MADKIKYEVIKNRDVESMLNAGNLASNAEVNLANNQGKLWSNLLGALEGNIDWTALEALDNQKLIRTEIQKYLKKKIVASGISLETTEKGAVAWSKDKKTRPIMKYTSDIAKVIHFGKSSELLPGDGTCAARCDILKACKKDETALEAVKRAMTIIDTAMAKVTPAEYADILKEFQTLTSHIATVQA